MPISPPLAPWGYTGEWTEPSGLVYLRARWYNGAWGRFTQVDPVAGVLALPGTRHPYAYGLNNSLRYSDLSGRIPGLLEAVLIGGAVGAVVEAATYVASDPGQAVGEYVQDTHFSKAVGRGAVAGAVGSAVGYGVGGLLGAGASKLLPKGAGLAVALLAGAGGGAGSSAATQMVTNHLLGRPLWQGVGTAAWHGAAIGTVTGGIGHGIRTLAGRVATSGCPGRRTVDIDFRDYPKNPRCLSQRDRSRCWKGRSIALRAAQPMQRTEHCTTRTPSSMDSSCTRSSPLSGAVPPLILPTRSH